MVGTEGIQQWLEVKQVLQNLATNYKQLLNNWQSVIVNDSLLRVVLIINLGVLTTAKFVIWTKDKAFGVDGEFL